MRKLTTLEKQLGRSTKEYSKDDVASFKAAQDGINPIVLDAIVQSERDTFIDNLLKKYVVQRSKPGSKSTEQVSEVEGALETYLDSEDEDDHPESETEEEVDTETGEITTAKKKAKKSKVKGTKAKKGKGSKRRPTPSKSKKSGKAAEVDEDDDPTAGLNASDFSTEDYGDDEDL